MKDIHSILEARQFLLDLYDLWCSDESFACQPNTSDAFVAFVVSQMNFKIKDIDANFFNEASQNEVL